MRAFARWKLSVALDSKVVNVFVGRMPSTENLGTHCPFEQNNPNMIRVAAANRPTIAEVASDLLGGVASLSVAERPTLAVWIWVPSIASSLCSFRFSSSAIRGDLRRPLLLKSRGTGIELELSSGDAVRGAETEAS